MTLEQLNKISSVNLKPNSIYKLDFQLFDEDITYDVYMMSKVSVIDTLKYIDLDKKLVDTFVSRDIEIKHHENSKDKYNTYSFFIETNDEGNICNISRNIRKFDRRYGVYVKGAWIDEKRGIFNSEKEAKEAIKHLEKQETGSYYIKKETF